ncbi:MarR family winged helix-turn-helix transcriptional regulator [Nonomuraea sediminis]|uniref:MarR family winged helix-turn-helix transcriptional regulator n=1 Tax=Nonomuraea sediminis TaxID=2835864 RepID=UPI001BDC062F|nr:MarR family winged helix-turn-helix transcriptional regulator [Nonomuraea sediminis]
MDERLTGTVAAFRQIIATLRREKMAGGLSRAAGMPLDQPDVQVLVYLLDAGEPRRVGAIADGLQVAGPHVTRHVSALEGRGLLERVRDPEDGRAWQITLTSEGDKVAQQCVELTTAWFGAAMADWPEEDRDELLRLLTKLNTDVTEHIQRQRVN